MNVSVIIMELLGKAFSDTQYTFESVMKMCSRNRIRIPLDIQNQIIMIIFSKKL